MAVRHCLPPEGEWGLYNFVANLYRQHAAELSAALALSTNDREAAQDLTHEVFAQALTRYDTLRDHPDPRGWLFRTGYNLARNRLRLLLRRRYQVTRLRPTLSIEAWEDTMDLRESLQKLSRRQRDVVILHCYAGFDIAEVAQMLGCGEGSVRTHLRRGRAELHQLLAPKELT